VDWSSIGSGRTGV